MSKTAHEGSVEEQTYGVRELIGAPIAFLLAFGGITSIVIGRTGVGLTLLIIAPFLLISRTWLIEPETGEFSLRYALFGISLYHKRWPFEKIDRLVIEPAGKGSIRFGSLHQVISLVIEGKRIQIFHSADEKEVRAEVKALRELLPRRLRVEKRSVYVEWKP